MPAASSTTASTPPFLGTCRFGVAVAFATDFKVSQNSYSPQNTFNNFSYLNGTSLQIPTSGLRQRQQIKAGGPP